MIKEKDTSVIPKNTLYCYEYVDGDIKYCPYHQYKDGETYCAYLEKTDTDIEKDMFLEDMKKGEIIEARALPFPVSLLWDDCKECGIGIEYDD